VGSLSCVPFPLNFPIPKAIMNHLQLVGVTGESIVSRMKLFRVAPCRVLLVFIRSVDVSKHFEGVTSSVRWPIVGTGIANVERCVVLWNVLVDVLV